MPENRSTRQQSVRASDSSDRMLSLVEVAKETGIPMPILLRYKREHPARVASTGSGSQQRFPEEALEIFLAIHRDEAETSDLPRRGGAGLFSLPRLRKRRSDRAQEEDEMAKKASKPKPEKSPASKKRAASRPSADAKPETSNQDAGEPLLSLQEVSKEMGIPYPTLARYMQRLGDRIPHVGKGRKRRFPPEALEVFRTIRDNSHPGRPPKGGQKDPLSDAPAPASRAAKKSPTPRKAATPPARTQKAAAADAENGNGDLVARIARLESSQQQLEEEIRSLVRRLSSPVSVTIHEI